MPTNSSSNNSSSFFWSRRNLVGMLIAGILLLAHVTSGGGLGALWPLVVACGWGVGFLMTKPQGALNDADRAELETGHDPLDYMTAHNLVFRRLKRRGLPQRVVDAVGEFQESARWVLEHWSHLESFPHKQRQVREILEQQLPDVFRAYENLPNLHNPEASSELIDVMQIVTKEMERIKQAINNNAVAGLATQTTALKLQYGTGLLPSMELEQPQSENPESEERPRD